MESRTYKKDSTRDESLATTPSDPVAAPNGSREASPTPKWQQIVNLYSLDELGLMGSGSYWADDNGELYDACGNICNRMSGTTNKYVPP